MQNHTFVKVTIYYIKTCCGLHDLEIQNNSRELATLK